MLRNVHSSLSIVVPEVGNRPVETGTLAIRIFGHNDIIAFTCLFMWVILSISRHAMSHLIQVNGIPADRYNCDCFLG